VICYAFRMARTNQGSYSFLDFTLDPAAERLIRGDSEVKLRPKSFQALLYLVNRAGLLVTREELLEALWGNVTVTDESVTKCIADIRRALSDDSQEIVRTVPRRGFLFQPEVHPSDPPQSASQSRKSALARVLRMRNVILLASLAAFGLAVLLGSTRWREFLFGLRPAFEAIAVLPFESLSTGTDQQYIADGMTEALITDLGQASPLRVIARTSVNRYLKTKKPVREIARELNVDVVVEGTVLQSGDRIRVTANLIQVSPEKHIWAHSYERSFRDALALQNELAGAITGEIQGKLATRQQAHPGNSRLVDPDAQLAYWKARSLLDNSRGEPELHRKAVEYSEQAVRIDPGYAPAHAALAMSYVGLSNIGMVFPKEVMPRARAAAQRAIALDEELPYAHGALGYILLVYDRDWVGAEREAKRAILLNPSDAEAHRLLSNYLAAVGRVDEAVVEMKRARELDPLSYLVNWNVGRMLCLARKYDEALTELQRTGDAHSNSPGVDIWIFKSRWMKAQADAAIAVDLRIRGYRDGFSAESLDALRASYRHKGSQGYWAKVRDLVLPKFRTNPIGWYRLAEINTYLGDREEAFRWLEKAFDERPNWIPFLKVDPTLDPLRSDPRFSELLRRMGLSP
jgi:TolB-like protein/DNA-binding winged helix-turn-helix (wHTH) protein